MGIHLQVWDNLHALAAINPVPNNLNGEYLTMFSRVRASSLLANRSDGILYAMPATQTLLVHVADSVPACLDLQGGLIFGIINLVGNFGTVFVDQAYWQSAIAAKPSASHKGYILGTHSRPFAIAYDNNSHVTQNWQHTCQCHPASACCVPTLPLTPALGYVRPKKRNPSV